MNVKDVLEIKLRLMMEKYSHTDDKYPKIPWSPEVDSRIYVGSMDSSSWIGWQPIEKNVIHDFVDIENELGISIHNDIKEFFNSFWFFDLSLKHKTKKFSIIGVIPGQEFKHILECWSDDKNFFTDKLYLSFGSEYEGEYSLMICNNDGSMATFHNETQEIKKISSSLAKFLYKSDFYGIC